MAISAFAITKIPNATLIKDSNDIDAASKEISLCFSLIIADFIINSNISSIEITFVKNELEIIPYLVIRHTEEITEFKKNIESELTKHFYTYCELSTEQINELISVVNEQLGGKAFALEKKENVEESINSIYGYNYYCNLLSSKLNINHIFNSLYNLKNGVMMFQLTRANLVYEEAYALKYSFSEMENMQISSNIHLHSQNNSNAYKIYQEFSNYESEKMLLGNILIATKDSNGANVSISIAKQMDADTNNIYDVVEIKDTKAIVNNYYKLPHILNNELLNNYRNLSIWNFSDYKPVNFYKLPLLYSIDEASLFFKLPYNDGKIRGFVFNEVSNDNEIIGDELTNKNNIVIGTLQNSSTTIGINQNMFSKHALIVGTPGSGKTTAAMNILYQFAKKGTPFLIIEPVKTEYRNLLNLVPNINIFTPGKRNVVPFIINPFVPPKGIELEQYIPSLTKVFNAAFSMDTPLDILFLRAVRQTYSMYGWKNNSKCTDKDVIRFGLYEFINVFKNIIEESGYKAETKANLESAGVFRLLNLLDQNKYIFDNINTIDYEFLANNNSIIELDAIDNEEEKALIILLILIGINLHLKSMGESQNTNKHLIMIDEAHVIFGNAKQNNENEKAKNSSIAFIQRMIAEIRAYGTGVIIADQAPSRVSSNIVADTDIKIIFRLAEKTEKDIVANSIGLSESQSSYLSKMKRGEAFLYCSSLNSPKIINTTNLYEKEELSKTVSNKQLIKSNEYWDSHRKELIPYNDCLLCKNCRNNGCDISIRLKADNYASYYSSTLGNRIKDVESLYKYSLMLHKPIIEKEYHSYAKENSIDIKTLINCTKIHFIRNVLMNTKIKVNEYDRKALLKKVMIKGDKEHE